MFNLLLTFKTITKFIGFRTLSKIAPELATGVSKALFYKKLTGSYKILTVLEQLGKEQIKKMLGPMNYLISALKFNIAETAKKLWRNRVHFELVKFIKLLNLLYKINAKEGYKNGLVKAFEILSNNKFKRGVLDIDKENVKPVLETLKYLRKNPKLTKTAVKDLEKFSIRFTVNSPETHNFSQGVHQYNFGTRDYIIPIRSGSHKYVRTYTYHRVSPNLVIDSLLGADFGKIVFNIMRYHV